jgi:hypothetical protein
MMAMQHLIRAGGRFLFRNRRRYPCFYWLGSTLCSSNIRYEILFRGHNSLVQVHIKADNTTINLSGDDTFSIKRSYVGSNINYHTGNNYFRYMEWYYYRNRMRWHRTNFIHIWWCSLCN